MAKTNFYGVRAIEQATPVTPATIPSGITIAFGTAPAHMVDGTANEIILANDYDEAVSALGYSDDWEKYTLCEVMYNHFQLYGISPVLFVNVLDAEKHKEAVEATEYLISDNQIELTGDAIAQSIQVTNGETTYEAGTDYDVLYNDGACIIEILSDGAIAEAGLTSLNVSYEQVAFEHDDMIKEVIGGCDATTGVSTGLELLDKAYYKTKVLPDIVIAPGWSDNSEVAAVMAAKTIFSAVFRAICLCDLDTTENTNYLDAAKKKEEDVAFQNTKQVICWPMVSLVDKVFHHSTQLAGQMGKVDNDNDGIPSEVASNYALQADSATLADGSEVLLDLTQANYLRGKGISTVLNFANGFTSWGAYTAAYPNNTDPKDMFINITRMFNYIANTAILTFWSKIDRKLTTRYAESIVDQLNLWLNGLIADNHLLGARVAFLAAENPQEDLLAGIIRVHIYLGVPFPAQEIDFLLEYDVDYAASVLGSLVS